MNVDCSFKVASIRWQRANFLVANYSAHWLFWSWPGYFEFNRLPIAKDGLLSQRKLLPRANRLKIRIWFLLWCMVFAGCLPETEVFVDIPDDPPEEPKDHYIEESTTPLFPVIKVQNGDLDRWILETLLSKANLVGAKRYGNLSELLNLTLFFWQFWIFCAGQRCVWILQT